MVTILSSDINTKVDIYYDNVKEYTEEVLDFYINAMKCINGIIPKKDITSTLYQSLILEPNTINSFFPPLIKDKREEKNKRKNKQTAFTINPKVVTAKKGNIYKLICPTSKVLDSHVKRYKNKYLTFFEDLKVHLATIIKGSPEELVALEKKLRNDYRFIKHYKVKGAYRRNISNILKKIFDYEKFASKTNGLPNKRNRIKWTHYDLASLLKINTCSYCNRVYTFTVFKDTGEGAIAPQFDHFFDKATSPIFGLSFFNLIPSCNFCNSSLKGTTKFSLDKYLHPYISELSEKATFTYIPNTPDAFLGKSDDLSVKIKPIKGLSAKEKEKVERTIKIFELEQTYTQHADYVSESVRKKYAYNDKYLEILRLHTYDGIKLGIDEAYRLAFGNYYYEKDFHKRPLAKLTKDIVKELSMI